MDDWRWRKVLEPYADRYREAYDYARIRIRLLSDRDLKELLDACGQAGPTNCGHLEYAAAQDVRMLAALELQRRREGWPPTRAEADSEPVTAGEQLALAVEEGGHG